MTLLRSLILTTLIALPSILLADDSIQILSASYGGKDVTNAANSFCQGVSGSVCEYKVSSKYIGQPGNNGKEDFLVMWQCADGSQYKHYVPGSAEGSVFNIACQSGGSTSSQVSQSSSSTGAAGKIGTSWDPLTAMKYPSSFHSMMYNGNQHFFAISGISKQCVKAVRDHLDDGGTFLSEQALQYTTTVGQYPVDTLQDGYVYHYTNADDAYNNALQGNLEPNFEYVRTKLDDMQSWYMYVASDRKSSKQYGKYAINIKLHPKARIFLLREGVPKIKAPDRHEEIVADVENDIIRQNPRLAACRNEGAGPDIRYPDILMRLIYEGSRITGVAYYGINNTYTDGICKGSNCKDTQWLQLIGPWVIQEVEAFTDNPY